MAGGNVRLTHSQALSVAAGHKRRDRLAILQAALSPLTGFKVVSCRQTLLGRHHCVCKVGQVVNTGSTGLPERICEAQADWVSSAAASGNRFACPECTSSPIATLPDRYILRITEYRPHCSMTKYVPSRDKMTSRHVSPTPETMGHSNAQSLLHGSSIHRGASASPCR
jgi:hypothetical protein